ncbi:DUF2291 domain-containing protein [Xinfangfangia sp. D13-10-4-6]|uniref:DUF2291 family protein n=1 Tax=Pseudogemmobacter hezensis TaxID=2737662 RepID=UPI001552FFBF|nr:DUF2291 domain-containing protein [Pseudogemmobacter hezensis]NPD16535.1 DUF2291 domain-containing protein [Pseudogemmobacter hezensis]
MSQSPDTAAAPRTASHRGRWILAGAAVVVLAAIALDTKVVHVGSEADTRQQAFSPDSYGTAEFPRIKEVVTAKAVDAVTLAQAVQADKAAASKEYGTPATTGVVMMVKFTGVAAEGKSGVYDIQVPGMPEDIRLRLQTGPAINGTDLRDAPGDIEFGAFKNQIEYQDAGSAINRAMKAAVLDGIDTANLTGKTLEVTGAFTLINAKMWRVTPVSVTVQ